LYLLLCIAQVYWKITVYLLLAIFAIDGLAILAKMLTSFRHSCPGLVLIHGNYNFITLLDFVFVIFIFFVFFNFLLSFLL